MSKTVLIVDDNAHIRSSLRCIIEQDLGWQVRAEASSGADGVAAAAQLKPNIVILDLSVPVMNGIQAARLLKQSVPEAYLLMFTSYPAPDVEDAARSAGIEAFVAKTDGLAALVDHLQGIAALRAAAG